MIPTPEIRLLLALSIVAGVPSVPVAGADSASSIAPRRPTQITSGTMQDPVYVRQLAEGQYLDGDLEGAVRLYLEVAQLQVEPNERAHALLNAAWLQYLLGDSGPSLASLHTALRFEPDLRFDARLYSPEFEQLYLKARVRFAREGGKRPAAARPAPPSPPSGAEAVYRQAVETLEHGDADAALTQLQRAASLTYAEERLDIRRSALLRLGLLYYERGQWGDAATAFEEAVALERADASAWKNLGLARKQQGETAAAIDAFREAYARQPGERAHARNLGQTLVRAERWDDAASWLGDAIRHHPRDARLRLLIGEAHAGRGADRAAAAAWSAAMELDDSLDWSVGRQSALLLALAHLEAGRFADAQSTALGALERDPADAAFWNLLGLAQQGAGQAAEASRSFLAACNHDDARAEYRNNLGRAYAAVGDLSRAEEEFVHALTLEPELPAAQANLAQVRRLLNK